MFGYVRPLIPELRVRELEDYKAVYCGLCRAMGKRHGFLARFTLNYDFAFLTMVLAYERQPCEMTRCRCPAHPLRKRKMCSAMPSLDVAADESLILSWQKLRDDVEDNGFFHGLPARIACWVLKPAYRKAAKARPEFDRAVTRCLDELHVLERENCPSLDRPADTFARILQWAAPDTGDDGRNRAMGQMLYHVGRWIYLLDAWDDMEKDELSGAYNPVLRHYQGEKAESAQDLRVTLRHSRSLAAAAYELSKAERWDGILSNIIYLGLPAMEEQVFSGNRKKKSIRRLNE